MERKRILLSAAIALLTIVSLCVSCFDEIPSPDPMEIVSTVKKQEMIIPFSVTAVKAIDTKASVDDNKQLFFEEGDKLVIKGEDLHGELLLTEGGGTASGTFKGNLYYTSASGSEPAPGLEITARLASANDQIGEGTFIGGIATDLVDAVQKYSMLTGVSTYEDKNFTLSEGTSFVECQILFDPVPADGNYTAIVTNENGTVPVTDGTVSISGGKSKFVICYPEGTVLKKSFINLNGCDIKFGGVETALAPNKIYNVYKMVGDDFVTPLTLMATKANTTITIHNPKGLTIEYAIDGINRTPSSDNSISIHLDNASQYVQLFGENASYGAAEDKEIVDPGNMPVNSTYIDCNKDCYVYGNVMSLVKPSGFSTYTTLTGAYAFSCLFFKNTHLQNHSSRNLVFPATTLTNACYSYMFYGCIDLTRAFNLPAETMTPRAYMMMYADCTDLETAPVIGATTQAEQGAAAMFLGCRNLETAPVLSATTLAKDCYEIMFQNCTSLETVAKLPATTMAKGCYLGMFGGCTSLTSVPEDMLPATTLATECYTDMFDGCTSLLAGPVLPAKQLVEDCYGGMFQNCSALNYIKCLATDITAEKCTYNWLDGVAGTGTFVRSIVMDNWPNPSASGIPAGWSDTFETGNALTLEVLTGGQIWLNGYSASDHFKYVVDGTVITPSSSEIDVVAGKVYQFFADNTTHNAIRFESSSVECYVYGNVMSVLSAAEFETMTTIPDGVNFRRMFCSFPGLKSHPSEDLLLPATTLTDNCYSEMFDGTGLSRAPQLPATTLAEGCYHSMFSDCASLTTAPELPATTLAEDCYSRMFAGSGLTTAPVLRATRLANGCYAKMFAWCYNLTTPPALPATVLANNCYEEMFMDSGLTSAPALPATELAEECYTSMFEECMSLTIAPKLLATTLAPWCYCAMFWGSGIQSVPADMLPVTTLAEGCYYNMFQYCEDLTTAPVLPATTLVEDCYLGMFVGCSSLNSVTCLATTNIDDGGLVFWDSKDDVWATWLDGVPATGTFYKAPSASWAVPGSYGIPSGWTVQEAE